MSWQILKNKAESRLKKAADKHWSDGALEVMMVALQHSCSIFFVKFGFWNNFFYVFISAFFYVFYWHSRVNTFYRRISRKSFRKYQGSSMLSRESWMGTSSCNNNVVVITNPLMWLRQENANLTSNAIFSVFS